MDLIQISSFQAFSPKNASGVDTLSFIPGTQIVAASSRDSEVVLWDISNERRVPIVVESSNVVFNNGREGPGGDSIWISLDGKHIASQMGRAVCVWSMSPYEHEIVVSEGRIVVENPGMDRSFVDFRNRICVFTSFDDSYVSAVNLDTGSEIVRMDWGFWIDKIDPPTAYSLSLSPDSKYLAAVASERTWPAWELDSGERLSGYGSFDGKGTDYSNVPDKILFLNSKSRVVGAAWPEDAWSGDRRGLIAVWNTMTGKVMSKVTVQGRVMSLAATPDGKTLVAGTSTGNVCVWPSAAKGHIEGKMASKKSISSVDADGYGRIAVGTQDGKVVIYSLS